MTTEFIVMTASAKMPSSCKGRYGKVALCEVTKGKKPAMISSRAKGMVRIIELWDKRNMGGPKSAYQLALAEAHKRCSELNGA